MKKSSNLLLITALLLAVFIAGILIGRYTNYNNVTICVDKSQFRTGEGNDTTANHATVSSDYKLNINTATADELQDLPGIGPELAKRIITYRSENGTFTNINELLNVSGIGDKKLSAIVDYITIGG